jgi:hypothetical protein
VEFADFGACFVDRQDLTIPVDNVHYFPIDLDHQVGEVLAESDNLVAVAP